MISLQKIFKSYNSQQVIKNIDLEISEKNTTVLIGPSGCGKSTLIKIMIGLIKPDSGLVEVEGSRLTDDNVLEVRRRMGYVIQNGGLFPHLTAQENISLMSKQLGWNSSDIDKRIKNLCELTNYPVNALDRYPIHISGGQQQRVGLMRSLMLDPDILLLDEPLGALDPLIRSELQYDLKKIFSELGKTVVMVTHDLGEAHYFADTTVLIRNGEIIQKGQIENFVNDPANEFVEKFVKAQRGHILQ